MEAASPISLPRSPGLKIIRRDDAPNWIDGYRFLDEARAAAAALLEDARRAHADAVAQGLEEGKREGAAEAASVVTGAAAQVDAYLRGIEGQLAALALSLVEQVIGSLPDAEAVTRAAAKALESFRREKHLVLRVSPEVVETVRAEAERSWAAAGPVVVVEADPRLAPRQCTIVTEFAVVDVSLEAQLAAMRAALTGRSEPAP